MAQFWGNDNSAQIHRLILEVGCPERSRGCVAFTDLMLNVALLRLPLKSARRLALNLSEQPLFSDQVLDLGQALA